MPYNNKQNNKGNNRSENFKGNSDRNSFRDNKEKNNSKDSREKNTFRGNKDNSSYRDNRDKDTFRGNKENNNFKDNRDKSTFRGSKDNSSYRDNRDKDTFRGNKENNNFNDNRERSSFRDSRDSQERNDYRDNREKNSFRDDLSPEDRGLIIGRNPVIEALKAEKQIDTIFVNSEAGGSIGMICRMAKEKGIVVKQVNDTKLSYMSNGASHQGVIASGACAEYVTVEDILAISKNKGTQPFIVVCDEIEDPHNLGAIIRTAEAAGADGIIIPKRRSASLNQTVFKTSAGAASWLPAARVSNIAAAIDTLKENGVWIYGTDSEGEDYTSTNLTGSMALVIGSEGNGVGRLIMEKCDFRIKLPMLGKITSLNASVAAGIFMYESVRQKQLKSK